MANSSDTFLSVDGISLQTLAWNVTTMGGSLEAPPPLRGSNTRVPSRPGASFVAKQPDSRIITLSMWVLGADEDGMMPTSGDRRAEFERNFKKLRQLFYTPGREISLTKRWRPYGSSTVVTATGKAQYAGGLSPTMTGRQRAVFTVDLEMADPFFYGSEVTVAAFTGVSQQQTIQVEGDYRTNDIKVEINGARVNPRLAITTPIDSMWVKYTYTLGSSDKATLDVKNYASLTTPSAGSTFPSGGLMTHGGDPFWLALDPGSNLIALTSTSGTGNVVIKYKPVWF